MEKPLIVRTMMAIDWRTALRLVWAADFLAQNAAAQIVAVEQPAQADIAWKAARAPCMWKVDQAADADVAAAWCLVAASPAGREWQSPTTTRSGIAG
jgi:hypothetical protein